MNTAPLSSAKLAELPNGWVATRLVDVTSHLSGNGKLIKGKLSDTPADNLFPAFSASGQDVWRNGYECEGEAIIVSAVGARCGKCFLATGKWSAIANTHVVWPQSDLIDRKFLWYRINDEHFWIRSGSAQPFVVVRKTFEQPIALPPLGEQQRIVAELEKQFTRLEAGVASLKRVQTALKRYRASVLKAACEGRLVPTEAELAHRESRAYEPAAALLVRILEERRAKWTGRGKYQEPLIPRPSDHEPDALPEGWSWSTVGQVIAEPLCNGISVKGSDNPPGVRALRLSAMSDCGFDYSKARFLPLSDADVDDLWIQPGDFFMSRGNGSLHLVGRGTTAQPPTAPTIFPDTMIRLRWATTLRGARWLQTLWPSRIIRTQIERKVKTTAGIYKIAQPQAEQIVVPLPPLAEQHRIVAEVERRLSVIEELEAVVATNVQRATRLRQSILQRAFDGGLVRQQPFVSVLPKTEEVPAKTRSRPNRHFARALLSAEIVHRLHAEPTFGRIKHQKVFHLCEHIARLPEIEGQYHREAAGPLDNRLIYANEAELKKQHWFEEIPREGYGHAYRALPKAGSHRKYLEGSWPDQLATIERLIELMRTWDTDRCEIFSTTYAAWNDLVLWGKEPTAIAILQEILERWHERKKRIPEDRWRRAIAWMQKEGFAPTGFGKPTCAPGQ